MPSGKRRSTKGGAGGAKTLLTVLALAGTLGGWAKLSDEGAADQAPTASPTPTPMELALPPLPTLVPAPDNVDAPVVVAPQPTQPALRRVSAPQVSSSSGGGGGRAAAVSRSSK
jgi:hypothetical protein